MEERWKKQKEFFESGATRPISFRIEQLKKLDALLVAKEENIMQALEQDLGKGPFESYVTEIALVRQEIKYCIRHVARWSRVRRPRTPISSFGCRSRIYTEPYGVALILSPWNYPLQLALLPMVDAMAAGNCVCLKLSEYSPATSGLLSQILTETYPPEYLQVVLGEKEAAQQLLELPYDTIFFTGSTQVGKTVMASAAKHLTPVTLELGGKSPCVVAKDADLSLAAHKIIWGKGINAGQTCVAPDYVLIHKDVYPQMVRQLRRAKLRFYGRRMLHSPDYGRIVNQKQYDRLVSYLQQGKVLHGGNLDPEHLRMEITLLEPYDLQQPVMQEEIFGPVLPLVPYETEQEAREIIRSRGKPLAFYYFGKDHGEAERWITSLPFGGGCVNNTIMHLTGHQMPFGGVGASGMGSYHGKAGFDAFSHQKSILVGPDMDLPLSYPPYKDKLKWVRKIF